MRPADWRVHGARVLWGEAGPFSKADFTEPDNTAIAVIQDATSAMNKQDWRWSRSFYAEGNEGLTPLLDFIQIKIHIVGHSPRGDV
jgi:hypothetical protein